MGKRGRKVAPTDPQRLCDLRRGSYASARATERLMISAREDGIPTAVSRTSMWRARKKVLSEPTPFGPLVQDMTLPTYDGDVVVAVQHPSAMLYKAMHTCEPFRSFFLPIYEQNTPSPAKPWHLCLYADEIGHNPIGRDNRKCECVYWSIYEFGVQALATEAVWFKVVVARTKVVFQVDGDMSHLFKIFLNQF